MKLDDQPVSSSLAEMAGRQYTAERYRRKLREYAEWRTDFGGWRKRFEDDIQFLEDEGKELAL